MIFKILAQELEHNTNKVFFWNSRTKQISEEEIFPSEEQKPVLLPETGKKGPFSSVKIQLGLSCNYSCSYCSQSRMAHAEETTKADIPAFLDMLQSLTLIPQARIEFWGGEPLVYWKTLKPLAEAIRPLYPDARFFTVTNGSLLTKEIIDWFDEYGFAVAISHDGPGQDVRGDDPFVDNREAIEYALETLLPKGRLSISSMLNAKNPSRAAIINYFEALFPEKFIPSSEMGFIDIYNEGGFAALPMNEADHFELRRSLWLELRADPKVRAHCSGQSNTIESIPMANNPEILQKPQKIGQKCGMDRPSTIALDLRGNLLTCQNTSADAVAPNSTSHKIGHVLDLENVKLHTSTHWTQREDCPKCPVLALCSGSCMFLQGKEFKASCDISYTDRVAMFAVGFEQVTGYIPIFIEGPDLPPHRQDIWGSILDWEVKPQRKVIPVVSVPSPCAVGSDTPCEDTSE